MPTSTVEERAAREKKRKEWASQKRILEAMAKSEARKLRMAQGRTSYGRTYSQGQYYGMNQSYGIRVRPIYIYTPTGRVVYWVPY